MAILDIHEEDDIVRARTMARHLADELEFSLIDKTRLATAVSELARNTLVHGGGGRVDMDITRNGRGVGVRCIFFDEGPGIADCDLALTAGYSTAGSLGHGLPGSRRLVDEFAIRSEPGCGTRVEMAKWK